MSVPKAHAIEALARVIYAREARENGIPDTWEDADELARAETREEAAEYIDAIEVINYVSSDLGDAFSLLAKYDAIDTAEGRAGLGYAMLLEVQTRATMSIAVTLGAIAKGMRSDG